MSRGLGKIERMVLRKAIEMSKNGTRPISRGAISNQLRREIFGFDKPASPNLQGTMWLIGAVKSGSRVFVNGHDLSQEDIEMHRRNRTLRNSISRAARSLVQKKYLIPTPGEYEWEDDMVKVNLDKCKRLFPFLRTDVYT